MYNIEEVKRTRPSSRGAAKIGPQTREHRLDIATRQKLHTFRYVVLHNDQ